MATQEKTTISADDSGFKNLIALRFRHLALPPNCAGFALLTEPDYTVQLLYVDGENCFHETRRIVNLETEATDKVIARNKFPNSVYQKLFQQLSLETAFRISTMDAMQADPGGKLDGDCYYLAIQGQNGETTQSVYINPQDSNRPEIKAFAVSLEKVYALSPLKLYWFSLQDLLRKNR